ncbi:MAG: DUF2892 domain-containing protein [Candidatus Nanohaloarchaeota archaeon QJJ-7]|nr:DUF2892 domain-containing protein [Candidatus Nanohaloarchaeota archaeon QJJ-7]
MRENVGDTDRMVRAALGAVMVIAGALGYLGYMQLAFGPVPQALASIIAVVVGAVLLITAATRQCAIYSALDMDTN